MTGLLVVSGEASGDLHAAELLKELRQIHPGMRIVGVAGDHSAPYFDQIEAHVRDLGMVGFVEVLRHLPQLKRLQARLLALVESEGIEHVLTVDYPGFNLRLAKALRRTRPGIQLHHYVCPQVWAWKKGRIPQLGRTLDTLYCLFDFEAPLFKGYAVEAVCMGNPLVDLVAPECDRAAFCERHGLDAHRPSVALLPGSRPGEVMRLLPPMLELVRSATDDPQLRSIQWILAAAPTMDLQTLHAYLEGLPVTLVPNMTYAARAYAQAAIVASGTATLETALLGTPFVTVYRRNPLSLLLARCVVKLPHFALANVVAGEKIVPELLQEEVNAGRLRTELLSLLDPTKARAMQDKLGTLRSRLGEPGAARRVAEHLAKKMTPA